MFFHKPSKINSSQIKVNIANIFLRFRGEGYFLQICFPPSYIENPFNVCYVCLIIKNGHLYYQLKLVTIKKPPRKVALISKILNHHQGHLVVFPQQLAQL